MVTGKDNNIIGHDEASPLNHEKMLSSWVKVTVTKPVSFKGEGYVKFFRPTTLPKNDTGILTLTGRRVLFSNS